MRAAARACLHNKKNKHCKLQSLFFFRSANKTKDRRSANYEIYLDENWIAWDKDFKRFLREHGCVCGESPRSVHTMHIIKSFSVQQLINHLENTEKSFNKPLFKWKGEQIQEEGPSAIPKVYRGRGRAPVAEASEERSSRSANEQSSDEEEERSAGKDQPAAASLEASTSNYSNNAEPSRAAAKEDARSAKEPEVRAQERGKEKERRAPKASAN